MLASFLGVLPILTPPLCVLAFIMCFFEILLLKVPEIFEKVADSRMRTGNIEDDSGATSCNRK
jgi:hypothetical protein